MDLVRVPSETFTKFVLPPAGAATPGTLYQSDYQPLPCQADKRRAREEKSALKPLKDSSYEMSESGEGLINRKGNAIWGTELL